MKKEKLKMIQVDEDTHQRFKELALSKGLSLKDYMRLIATNEILKSQKAK